MTPGKVQHLGYLGLGNLVCIDPAQPDALLMHVQHDPGRLLARTVEKTLKHEHDEFHRRIIIVQKQHAVERRLLGLDAGFRGQVEACAAVFARGARRRRARHKDRVKHAVHG